jgi:tetratricopeptide (TPR) repeat protein
MTQDRQQILIDHLDRVLAGEPSPETEALISSDPELAKEWHAMSFALQGIREAGLYEKVSIAKNQYQTQQSFVASPAGGVVRTLYRNVFKVAACLLLLIGAATIYKFSTVSSGNMYKEYYQSFELNTSRSSAVQDTLEQAYRAKNWKQVLSISSMQKPTTTKISFLTAMAAMELKEYATAIASFKEVMAANASSGDNYFQDESEYYLALAYLANNEVDNALPLLQKIRNDENHTYHQKAKELSGLDLMILDLKSGK